MRLFLEQSIWQWVVLYTLFRLVAYVASTKRAGEGRGGGGECESKSQKREPSLFPSVTPFFFPQVPSGNCGTVGLVKFAILSVSVGVHLRIGHVCVPKTLTFNEAKCISNLVKMSFICMRMKNPFHIKGWPLNLVLIQRPRKLTRPSFFSFLTWRIGCISREICFNQSQTLLGNLESSDVIWRGNQWWRHEISAVLVSGYN